VKGGKDSAQSTLRVSTPTTHIYCLKRADQEVTVSKQAMTEKGGWAVDGEDTEE
jgi:hypothetical protein